MTYQEWLDGRRYRIIRSINGTERTTETVATGLTLEAGRAEQQRLSAQESAVRPDELDGDPLLTDSGRLVRPRRRMQGGLR